MRTTTTNRLAFRVAIAVLVAIPCGCSSEPPEPDFGHRDAGHDAFLVSDGGGPVRVDAAASPDADPGCVSTSAGCIWPTPDDMDGDGVPASEDCDDLNYYRSPRRREVPCNSSDENCDGIVECIPDRDRDGEPDATDCAPDDETIRHDGYEIICDGIDQDCDGLDPCDRDGDFESELIDCDDSDPTRAHRIREIVCDGIDQNCNGRDCCEEDLDGDGSPCREDCNDSLQRVHPGAEPAADCEFGFEDRNCDGVVDFPCGD